MSRFDQDLYDAWNGPALESTGGNPDPIPEGYHTCKITHAKFTEKSDESSVSWRLVVVDGVHVGKSSWKNSKLSPKSIPYIREDLRILDVDCQGLDELEYSMPECVGKVVEVNAQQKGEYLNLYFQPKRERKPEPKRAPKPSRHSRKTFEETFGEVDIPF